MAKEIIWTTRAETSLEEIIDYLEEEWGPDAAKRFVKKVYAVIDLLGQFPRLGSLEDEKRQIRGFLIIKPCRLFYRTEEESLILLHFFSNYRDPDSKEF